MSFMFHREPKFVYSYRRLRKEGAFNTFINGIQIEFARLINHRYSEEKASLLYPMEGGKYFEISSAQRKDSHRDIRKNNLTRIFKPLQQRTTIPSNKGKNKPRSTWT
jgi:hypothetical protein